MARQVDIANEYVNGQGLPPQTISSATTTSGTAIDCQDCGPEVTSSINVGTNPGNDTTITVNLFESSDNSTFTAMTTDGSTAASHTAISGDSTNQHETKTFFRRTKRYVRQNWVTTGTSVSAICSGSLHCPKVSY